MLTIPPHSLRTNYHVGLLVKIQSYSESQEL